MSRRKTILLWALVVIVVNLIGTAAHNIYITVIEIAITVYALYRILKIDQKA
ncbi:hypothetical protein [Loigolactobacillus coryniformis]|uniref:hypothetical protein n=1 Tax=Loigolactobacillus coryniformis TaxID=1610 RepID=UPI001C5D10A7|nr:hypothetical protein [Loigolactobacillus coryniformis]MBW4803845.1 hypothetical protein [Loigolactobacillus coryniformis subsp. torquens]MBW4806441.1 hypothetical protein [Loigolactobacillus coryniformis subsp. torquens]